MNLGQIVTDQANGKDAESFLEFYKEVADEGTKKKLLALPASMQHSIGRLARLSKESQQIANELDWLLSERLFVCIRQYLHDIPFVGGG